MKKRKKRVNKNKILIIVLIIVFIIIGCITNIVLTDRNLTIFEKTIKDSVLTVQKVITYPFDFIIDKVKENKEKNKMYDEYQKLKQQLEDSTNYITQNEELKKQIAEMKTLLEINNVLSDYESINATVIGRDLSYWSDNITIDKGEKDGIQINMPVIVSGGLIGKVVKTSTFNSTVRLLTSNNSNDKISVKIKNGNEYIYGILTKYDSKTKHYIIEGISQNVDINEDLIVTTTGMGDIYPAGIIIGKVKGISTDNFDLSKVLEVETSVNFDSINYVKVLKRGDL